VRDDGRDLSWVTGIAPESLWDKNLSFATYHWYDMQEVLVSLCVFTEIFVAMDILRGFDTIGVTTASYL